MEAAAKSKKSIKKSRTHSFCTFLLLSFAVGVVLHMQIQPENVADKDYWCMGKGVLLHQAGPEKHNLRRTGAGPHPSPTLSFALVSTRTAPKEDDVVPFLSAGQDFEAERIAIRAAVNSAFGAQLGPVALHSSETWHDSAAYHRP